MTLIKKLETPSLQANVKLIDCDYCRNQVLCYDSIKYYTIVNLIFFNQCYKVNHG